MKNFEAFLLTIFSLSGIALGAFFPYIHRKLFKLYLTRKYKTDNMLHFLQQSLSFSSGILFMTCWRLFMDGYKSMQEAFLSTTSNNHKGIYFGSWFCFLFGITLASLVKYISLKYTNTKSICVYDLQQELEQDEELQSSVPNGHFIIPDIIISPMPQTPMTPQTPMPLLKQKEDGKLETMKEPPSKKVQVEKPLFPVDLAWSLTFSLFIYIFTFSLAGYLTNANLQPSSLFTFNLSFYLNQTKAGIVLCIPIWLYFSSLQLDAECQLQWFKTYLQSFQFCVLLSFSSISLGSLVGLLWMTYGSVDFTKMMAISGVLFTLVSGILIFVLIDGLMPLLFRLGKKQKPVTVWFIAGIIYCQLLTLINS